MFRFLFCISIILIKIKFTFQNHHTHRHFPRTHANLHHNCDICSVHNRSTDNIHSSKYYEKSSKEKGKVIFSPTVDVFLIVTRPQDYKYIQNGNFWITPAVIKAFIKMNDTRIHIFSETDAILRHGNSLGFPYFMHDMRSFQFLDVQFFGMYERNHHSINPMAYEYLCFYRWHLFRQAMQEWEKEYPASPMQRILTIDLDVLMLRNAAMFFEEVLQSLSLPRNTNYSSSFSTPLPIEFSFELIVIANGAVHLWSPHGLTAYSDFIYNWYNQSSEAVLAKTKKHAGYLFNVLHFSDMQMVKVFMDEKGETRNGCYVDASLNGIWTRTSSHQCLLDALGCIPMGRYDDMMKNNTLHFDNTTSNVQIRGRDEYLPYCLMVNKILSSLLLPVFSLLNSLIALYKSIR